MIDTVPYLGVVFQADMEAAGALGSNVTRAECQHNGVSGVSGISMYD